MVCLAIIMSMCYLIAIQKTISLSYNVNDFAFVNSTDGFQILSVGNQNIVNNNVPGSPNLPKHNVIVAVPDGANFDSLSFYYDSIIVQTNIQVAPTQPCFSSEMISYVGPDTLYYNSSIYPLNMCTYVSTKVVSQKLV